MLSSSLSPSFELSSLLPSPFSSPSAPSCSSSSSSSSSAPDAASITSPLPSSAGRPDSSSITPSLFARVNVLSRSIRSRSKTSPVSIWSRQASNARIVNGDSQIPPSSNSRPASIRLAIAISPSRVSSSTVPISLRYIRTGSSEPRLSSERLPVDFSFSSDSSSSASSA